LIRGARLLLDSLSEADVASLVALAGDPAIADTTISVPHPLDERVARDWLASLAQTAALGGAEHFAIREAAGRPLVGMVSLRGIDREHEEVELSFWVGRPFWGRGYATEAAGAAVDRAFDVLGMNRIVAHYMVRNPASGRVLARLGFRQEGLLRERVKKWGVYEDVVLMALLRRDRVAE
jgi:RimJ/RimL family protein N-acetyltransferase